MKQLSIYETDYLEDLNTINHFDGTAAYSMASPLPTPITMPVRPDNAESSSVTTETSNENSAYAANVTEIIIAKNKADSIQMVLPMLSQLNQEQRWLAWIDPPIQLLKKWQETHQALAMEEIMILRSSDSISAYELSKRALEAGTCHAVIAWTDSLSQEEFEQLEHSSAKGNSHGIVLRHR
jgi:cell division inhibitor SulA